MRRFAFLVAFAGLAACARYEWRMPACSPEPLARSQISWTPDTSRPRLVHGHVRYLTEDRPATSAQVALDSWEEWKPVAPDGTFEFPAADTGPVVLRVRQLGYVVAEIMLDLSASAGAEVDVQLLPHQITMDGCGSVLVRVRKPWWKFW